jgi:ADP-ribosyl-[dinitrogen reductase] hydrolase
MTKDKILGGLYGLLVGDACGVPYEFKKPTELPASKYQLSMIPPADFDRAWYFVEPGTYSDDGAQALCLLETFLECGPKALPNNTALLDKLRSWMNNGYMSVDSITFDVGMQTQAALREGANITGLNDQRFNGNGSLMRSLPCALVADSMDRVVLLATEQSKVTHPHIRSQLCCAMYNMIAWQLLQGQKLPDAINIATERMKNSSSEYMEEVKLILAYENNELKGSGYVVDSLWSAIMAVYWSDSYGDAIQRAIAYGNDTDTTACIAGGLAGIIYGFEGIRTDWLNLLRGREIIDPLAQKLVEMKNM